MPKLLVLILLPILFSCASKEVVKRADPIADPDTLPPIILKLPKLVYPMDKRMFRLTLGNVPDDTVKQAVVKQDFPVVQTVQSVHAVSTVGINPAYQVTTVETAVRQLKSNVKQKPIVVTETPLERALADYSIGTIGYDVPTIMKLGRTERITVKLSKSLMGQQTSSKVKVESIRVYTFMAVKLFANEEHFRLTSLSNEQQLVFTDVTQWEFNVIPKKIGKSNLSIRVSARIKLEDGSEEVKDFPVYSRDVYVKVDSWYLIKDWIKQYGQVVGGIIGGSGICTIVYNWWRKRRKKK